VEVFISSVRRGLEAERDDPSWTIAIDRRGFERKVLEMSEDVHQVKDTLQIRELAAAFDAANATTDTWDARVHEVGLWETWKERGADLRHARDTFLRVAAEPDAGLHWRAHSLTNAANALDSVGRPFEALDLYDRADRLQPNDGMVRGNRGMLLAGLMPYVYEAHEVIAHRAISDLDFAIAHPDQLTEQALPIFRMRRERIGHHASDRAPTSAPETYQDPYSAWAARNRLVLSTGVGVDPDEENLDRAHLRGLTTRVEDFTTLDSPIPAPLGAINAIKRDYLSARYAAWLALENPPEALLADRTKTAFYVDTLDYAKWDLATGLAAMALSSATNLTDKIGTFLVLWLKLPRSPNDVNDRNWCFAKSKAKPARIEPVLDALMTAHQNRLPGLLGLIDIAQGEAGEPRTAGTSRRIRNASVHRFLSVRYFGDGQSTPFVEGVSEDHLADGLLEVLGLARRMYLQAILAVAQHGNVGPKEKTVPMMVSRFQDPSTRLDKDA
jgi:tetratricopeptide (TPR) repeat protein